MDIPQSILEKVRSLLSARFSKESRILQISPVAGGCIHHAHVLETSTGRFFLKWNGAAETGNFAAELKGLRLLAAHSRGFTAVPLGCGNDEKYSLLLLEFIRQGPPSPGFWPDFGRKLSELHRHTSQFFGLEEDNYIGRLHQSNRRHAGFVSFFTEERLEPQVRLARSGQLIDAALCREFEALYRLLPGLIPEEPPALLHGDLWHGNFLCGENGSARLIDPAVYYGHREAEIAFTQLFGGFNAAFYAGYQESFPLQPGWRSRTGLFNLYPLLVHLNLFGSAYLSDVKRSLRLYR